MIGIDLRLITNEEVKRGYLYTGFSIFSSNVIRGIIELKEENNFCIIVYKHQSEFVKSLFPQLKIVVIGNMVFELLNRITKREFTSLQLKLGVNEHIIKTNNIDFIWYPVSCSGGIISNNTPYAVTLHDLITVHNVAGKDEWGEKTLGAHSDLINSRVNITISDYVKSDLEKYMPDVMEKTVTIRNPVVFDVDEKTKRPEYLNDKPYILDINGYGIHKNAITLLKAFKGVIRKYDINLIFCGGWKHPECYREMESFIKKNNLEDSVLLLYKIPAEEKNWLLQNARIFVSPSLDEGFGATPIEAAMRKIPVITTKESSLYEVTMGLLNYVDDARDPKQYEKLINELLINQVDKEELEKISKTLIERYEPQTVVQKYIDVFEHARNAY